MRATESLEISAQHTPVGDPTDELVVLVDDGDALGIGGRQCFDGVLERIRCAKARHGVGEGRSACVAVGPVAERKLDVAGGDDAGELSVVSDDG